MTNVSGGVTAATLAMSILSGAPWGAQQTVVKKQAIAHRGASAYAPEHTLEAYRLAIEQRADFVEQDLAVTKDGILVCIHDLTLERTTNVEEVFPTRFVENPGGAAPGKRWLVGDFTLEELKQLFVEERSVTRVHRAEGAIRKIDFHQRLTALVDGVEIGGSDDAKGYGGFSYRVVMPPDIRFTGAQGVVPPIENAVSSSPWMDVSGSYGAPGKSGVTVLTHPSTTGFPQPWILRARGSMQNAVYPGRQLSAIPRDRPVILRYRIVLHRGELAPADIGRLQAEYAGERIAQ